MSHWSLCPSLYNMALHSLVRWAGFDIRILFELPGCIKEDLLKFALVRGKCKENFTYFLHPDIKKLDIGECEIKNEDLLKISTCAKLKILEMNPQKYCRFDHNTTTLKMMFSRLNNLIKLHIQRNEGFTDSVVAVITKHCPLLMELDVSGCTRITDETPVSIATLAHIRAVNLSNTQVSDEGLQAMSVGQCSTSLVELKLNNCVNISDEGVSALAIRCKRLTILVFCNCPKVSVDCQLALNSFLNKDRKSKLVTWTVYV